MIFTLLTGNAIGKQIRTRICTNGATFAPIAKPYRAHTAWGIICKTEEEISIGLQPKTKNYENLCVYPSIIPSGCKESNLTERKYQSYWYNNSTPSWDQAIKKDGKGLKLKGRKIFQPCLFSLINYMLGTCLKQCVLRTDTSMAAALQNSRVQSSKCCLLTTGSIFADIEYKTRQTIFW